MLDYDLAKLYQIETKALKQAVRRNLERFPDDFMFTLSQKEYNELIINIRSQFVTFDDGRGKYPKYAPFAFTELGVAMLSSVLKSDWPLLRTSQSCALSSKSVSTFSLHLLYLPSSTNSGLK